MIRRPPRSTLDRSSAASDVYKRQACAPIKEPRISNRVGSTQELYLWRWQGWRDSCTVAPAMLILLLAAALAFTQQTGVITGTIVEARTGTPLPAVLVKVQSTGQQAFSDGDGKFEIKDAPVGAQTL